MTQKKKPAGGFEDFFDELLILDDRYSLFQSFFFDLTGRLLAGGGAEP
jgi:hypothetical protein